MSEDQIYEIMQNNAATLEQLAVSVARIETDTAHVKDWIEANGDTPQKNKVHIMYLKRGLIGLACLVLGGGGTAAALEGFKSIFGG